MRQGSLELDQDLRYLYNNEKMWTKLLVKRAWLRNTHVVRKIDDLQTQELKRWEHVKPSQVAKDKRYNTERRKIKHDLPSNSPHLTLPARQHQKPTSMVNLRTEMPRPRTSISRGVEFRRHPLRAYVGTCGTSCRRQTSECSGHRHCRWIFPPSMHLWMAGTEPWLTC